MLREVLVLLVVVVGYSESDDWHEGSVVLLVGGVLGVKER